MKFLRYAIVVFFLLMALLCGLLAFLPVPSQSDMASLYKSTYLREIDSRCRIAADAVVSMQYYTSRARGSEIDASFMWLFLDEIEKKHDMTIKIFSRSGYEMTPEGILHESSEGMVLRAIESRARALSFEIAEDRYKCLVPVIRDEREIIFSGSDKSSAIGYFLFTVPFHPDGFFGNERRIIFISASVVFSALLAMLLLFDPERRVKRLFRPDLR